MKTFTPKTAEISRDWLVIDAEGLVLGRVATVAASLLRGKHRVTFASHMDMGDNVIIINCDKVVITASKATQNFRYRHSGYPGGIRSTSWGTLLADDPEKLVYEAVKGMIPKNRLGRQVMMKLHVYKGAEHPHIAQAPQKYDTSAIRRG